MEKRPIIKIELTTTDKITEFFGLLSLIFIWILSIFNYADLPEIIPVHYNGTGVADTYGSKNEIFSLPVVASVIFIALTVLNFFPHLFNYPGTITEENAEKLYRTGTRLMRSLKIIVVVIFTLIVYMTQQTSKGNTEGLGEWFILLVFALIFTPILYFLTQMTKNS